MKTKLSFILAALFISGSLFAADELKRPRITGISHVAFWVHDIEKSRAFYKDFLGFDEPYTLTNKNGSLHLTWIKVNDQQTIELFPEYATNRDRLYHIALVTDDAEAMRVYLKSKGVTVPDKVKTGEIGNKNFTVTDPNQHMVEIVQYMPDGWTLRTQGKFMPDTRISTHLRHVGILVTKLDSMLDFYRGILGAQETWRGSATTNKLSWVNIKVPEGEDYIEFMLVALPPPDNNRGTQHHISLEVPDIEKAKAILQTRAAKVNYTRPLDIHIGINRKRQLNLYDPDGTRVELMEPGTIDGVPAPSSTAPPP